MLYGCLVLAGSGWFFINLFFLLTLLVSDKVRANKPHVLTPSYAFYLVGHLLGALAVTWLGVMLL